MIFTLAPGNQIPLSFQAFNYDAALYVQVFLRDASNNALPDSPIQLTAGSNGIYTNTSIVMPSTPYVSAQYVVYSDSGYSTVSTTAGSQLDTFINVEIQAGQPLPLYCQLFDYNPNKYVKAYVLDETSSAIAGSPVELPSLGLGLYGLNQLTTLIAPTTGAVSVQYLVYDDSGYSVLSTSEGAGNDVITLGASLFFLELGGQPNVGDALMGYFVPLALTRIVKATEQFQVKEYGLTTQFRGVWIPASSKLDIQSHGQRKWGRADIYTTPGVPLKPDDVISYKTVQYRVMDQDDYSLNGYMHYSVVEDYTGSSGTFVQSRGARYLLTQGGDRIVTQSGVGILV